MLFTTYHQTHSNAIESTNHPNEHLSLNFSPAKTKQKLHCTYIPTAFKQMTSQITMKGKGATRLMNTHRAARTFNDQMRTKHGVNFPFCSSAKWERFGCDLDDAFIGSFKASSCLSLSMSAAQFLAHKKGGIPTPPSSFKLNQLHVQLFIKLFRRFLPSSFYSNTCSGACISSTSKVSNALSKSQKPTFASALGLE
jgi:hypothetical protein